VVVWVVWQQHLLQYLGEYDVQQWKIRARDRFETFWKLPSAVKSITTTNFHNHTYT